MRKVLVTGGAGFLGSHLCKKLLTLDYQVYCLNNLYTGSLNNIKTILSNKNFHFIEHDITSPINLACPPSPRHYQNKPISTTKTSILGAINVLELAKKYDCKVLQTSTSEVYGVPLEHPQEITMLELAKLIIQSTNSQSTISFKSLPMDDPTKRMPNILKAKELLGWSTKIDFCQSLDLTINYFREILNDTI